MILDMKMDVPYTFLILFHQGVKIATVISMEQVRCLRIRERRGSDSRGPGKRRAAIRPRLVSTYPRSDRSFESGWWTVTDG